MALINCPECNKEISDKAETCPNCGVRLRPQKLLGSVSWGALFVMFLIGVACIVWGRYL